MSSRTEDRRNNSRNIQFPMCDANGSYIGEDRRSGMDRRKWETDKIAVEILASLV